LEEAASYICEKLIPGDLLLIMGAGDIARLADMVVSSLRETVK
jgi:UDP-N-acetylmuramate-alanine ligase